jgi:hypothetical protein
MRSTCKLLAGLALFGLIVCNASARPDADTTSETTKWVLPGSEVVLNINFRQILGSELMKKGGTDALKGILAGNEDAKRITDVTGIDPFKDLDSVTLSATVDDPKSPKVLLVVRGKFNQKKIHEAAEKFAEKEADKLKLVKEDDKQLYEIKSNDKPLVGAFQDSNTFVLTHSKEATLTALKSAGRESVKVNKNLEPALKPVTGKESLVVALVVGDELKKQLEKAPQAKELAPKLQSVLAQITLTDGASTVVTVNTEDAATAKKVQILANQAKGLGQVLAAGNEQFGPLATEVLNAIKMNIEKGTLTISLNITPEMIKKAAAGGDK